jgi:hypothetical protein
VRTRGRSACRSVAAASLLDPVGSGSQSGQGHASAAAAAAPRRPIRGRARKRGGRSALSPSYPERVSVVGTAAKLRAWQQEALDALPALHAPGLPGAATPGSGKTAPALRAATELLRRARWAGHRGVPDRAPEEAGADAAARVGIDLDPTSATARAATAAASTASRSPTRRWPAGCRCTGRAPRPGARW